MPPSTEVRGWARLLAGVADQVVGTVQDMHRAVTDGAFRWFGPIGRPVKHVNDIVTSRVYDTVRAALRGAGEIGAAAAGRLGTDQPSPVGTRARAIAHGVVGAHLMALAPELDLDVALRHDGRTVVPDVHDLAGSYSDAGGRVAVFVHGLVHSEAVWFEQPRASVPLPQVAAELGFTPLLVRYGTGGAIGRNGADLSELLEAVVTAWPAPITEITIVGHSMGGLVARAACRTAGERSHTWTQSLTDIVYFGTPHLGSWLEKVANVGSWVLRRSSPYSAPIGTLLDGRSRGIKDLRFGTLVEDGWGDSGVDDLLTGLVEDEPWLADVTHHVIVGRLRPAQRHPLNAVLGDGLVRAASASGHGRFRRIGDGQVVVLPIEAMHTRLMQHPAAAAMVRRVLARG